MLPSPTAPRSVTPADTFDPFAGPALSATVPSTAPQRELWAATCMGDEASLAFNESITITLRGTLNVDALEAAAYDLVARHEGLRTTFSPDGLAMLVAAEPGDVAFPRHDWTALDAEGRGTRLAALQSRVVREPFDLEHGPLVRFELARSRADEYALVVTAHHIVCDGWSFGVLAADLAALYTAHCRGLMPALPEPDRFTTYAAALAEPDALAATADAAAFWTARHDPPALPIELPRDRPRPAVRTFAAGRVDHGLAPELVRRITRAGAAAGVSLFAVLFAGFGALVQRLTGQSDLVIGIPTAGQPTSGVPGLVGHLVHLLPMRLRVDTDASCGALTTQARSVMLDGYEHQALTFGALIERLVLPRDPSRPVLASLAFNVDRALGPSALRFDGLTATLRSNPRAYETFEIFLNAVELDGAFMLECQYNTALYDAATVRSWLIAYERLLEGMAADPAASVGAIRIVDGNDRASLVAGPERALPERPLVHALIAAQVARTPDGVAVDDGNRALTYGELDARANQLARHLRRRGVREGTRVGLCLGRSVDLLVALVAVLKAGGAYVPLDPEYPLDRLRHMTDDAALAVLLTEQALYATLPLPARAVVTIDGEDDARAIAAEPVAALPADDGDDATPDSPAYVIYTSGSTGRPKGVLVPHRAVVNLLCATRETPGMTADDVVLAITTLSFDIAVSEVLLPLTVGAKLVLTSRGVAADGPRLRALVERTGITFIDATPATYRLLLAAGWRGARRLRLICTGEAMPLELAEALLPCAGAVWNGYGPTETTVWSTFWRVQAPVARVLIGRPVANTRAYVLDAQQQLVVPGVVGELYIGGTGVALGYLNRPDLTAERFLADPFAAAPGDRMYRTGDLARVLADGSLECLGRTDQQVKLRGFRIELGEIENALDAHPEVVASAVTLREDRPGEQRLVAYLVPSAAATATDTALRDALRRQLPDYMIPQAFVRLPGLPLTPSGKVDRMALPSPQERDVVRDDGHVEPRTAAERLVADLWADTLRVSRVGASDDFFQLGGHSMMASQVLARLRRDHALDIPYRRIFEAPTVERFAVVLEQARADAKASVAGIGAPPDVIPHVAGRLHAPLSVLQQRIWNLEELDPSTAPTHAYSAAWWVRGPVDTARVDAALRDFARRHDQLRTRFVLVDGAPVQIVEPEPRLVLQRLDWSDVPDAERELALATYFAQQEDVPFDRATAPLFRSALITFGPDEHLLYTLRHGLVWDGWSFDIFVREFAELYAARREERAPTLPDVPVTYGDFAAWQAGHLTSPAMRCHVEWWRAHLGTDLPVLELPTDRPRPAHPTYRGGGVSLAFSRDEVDQLSALAREHGATLFMVFFAAYSAVLARHAGQRELLVGTPVRARTHAETEHVVGPFVNTVMLRVAVDPAEPFAVLLGRVRELTLDALGHQDMPFELLGNKMPVVRALFSMQDARDRPLRMGDVDIEQLQVPQHFATNDLMLWTMENADGLVAVLNYSSDLFDAGTAERFLEQLRTLLLALRDDARQLVGRLPLLAADARRLALGASVRRVGAPDPAPPPVAARFADIVATHGGRAAVHEAGQSTSYAALAAAVAAVRTALAELGVPVGARVAVLAGTAVTRAAALLGALGAGATAIVLDPADPVAYQHALLDVVRPDVAVADSEHRAMFGDGVPVLDPARLPDAAAPPLVFAPDAPAMLVHEVGPAGRPTIAALTQAQLSASLAGMAAALGGADGVVATAGLSPASPDAVLALLFPLLGGGQAVAAPTTDDEGDALIDLLDATSATMLVAPATTWQAVTERAWCGAAPFTAAVVGPAPAALLTSVGARGARVVTIYGQPAAGVWNAVAGHAPTSVDGRAPERETTLGQPVRGTRLFVLDDQGEPAPIGVPGWLHLGGVRLDASAIDADARLVADPLDDASARAFRTGERAVRRVDGMVRLLSGDPTRTRSGGRVIALGAIAAALRSHPGVADAAAAVQAGEDGAPWLVGFVVPARTAAYTETELRRRVRELLPAGAVPQRFVELETLPHDEHGAVDIARLPRPIDAFAAARSFVAPTTDAERAVAALWEELLATTGVSADDNFFACGGYSLLCFQFVERLRQQTGMRVSPRVVLLGTLAQVAAELDARPATATATAIVGSTPPKSPDRSTTGIFGRLKELLGGVS